MANKKYDIIILGAGCAGMQLVHALISHSNYANESILLVDADKVHLQSKSWCFWHTLQNHPYTSIIHKKWNSVTIGFETQSKMQNVNPYNYCYIKSEDFYAYHFEKLKLYPQVTYSNNEVKEIEKKEEKFYVTTNEEVFFTNTLYSSYWDVKNTQKISSIYLKQQFFGWEIETKNAVFDDTSATMMDFNIEQTEGVNFAYILPMSKTKALVEITCFCATDYTIDFFEKTLQNYIQQKWNTPFTIEKIEHASIPMTNYTFNRYTNEGAIAIGTAAGMVKPTTGYAFNRILKDSQLLANAFFEKKEPESFKHNRFKFYDQLLLNLLSESPDKALHILITLFKKVPYNSVLKFLDEETSVLEEALLFLKLPKKDFLKQLL